MIVRFDPFRDLDRFVGRDTSASANHRIPMDAVRTDDAIVVDFDLPGVDPASVDVTVENRELVLTVTRERGEIDRDRLIAAERPHGTFRRSLRLGESLDPSGVEANFHHGVLTLTIPLATTAQPRKVAVGVGAPTAEALSEPAEDSDPEG